MERLFLLYGAKREHPDVAAWFADHNDALGALGRRWFEAIRGCGADVEELIHDHLATACVGDAAFAYIGIHSAHVTLGLFHAVDLPDPARLLEGTGKRMRHAKLRPGVPVNEAAVQALVEAAYRDIVARVTPPR